jgi:hypothetical protein
VVSRRAVCCRSSGRIAPGSCSRSFASVGRVREPWLRVWRVAVCALVGVVCAFIGMLPWLVHGARLVPQNLWAIPTVDAADMPIVFLPFSQYQLDLVAGVIVVGSLIAGVAARLLADRGMWGARVAVVGGLLVAQAVALVQTAAGVASGLQFVGGVGEAGGGGVPDDAMAYMIVVCAWIALTIGIGVLAFVLLTRRSSASLPVGVALAAVVLGPWIRGFVSPLIAPPLGPGSVGSAVAMWLPAVLLGAGIGWAGLWVRRPRAEPAIPLATDSSVSGGPAQSEGRIVSPGRIVSAVAAIVILWVGVSVLTGLVSAAGSRALLRLPDELAQLIVSVTAAELRGDALVVAAGAAVLGAVGIAAHEVIARSTHQASPGSTRSDPL